MNKLKMIYNKTDKKHLGIIVLAQSVLLILLLIALVQKNAPSFTIKAAEPTFSEIITQDAKTCLSLDPESRPVCARTAGIKIAGYTSVATERLAECLKFRPYYVHDCQLGLAQQ